MLLTHSSPKGPTHCQHRKNIVDHRRSSAVASTFRHPLALMEGLDSISVSAALCLPPRVPAAVVRPLRLPPTRSELHYTPAEVTSCFYRCLSPSDVRALLRSSASDISSLLGVRNFPHSCPSAQETDGGCDDELPWERGIVMEQTPDFPSLGASLDRTSEKQIKTTRSGEG